MKILLISPPLHSSDRYGKDLGKVGPTTEPLGLAYLAGALLKSNYQVDLVDCAAIHYGLEDIKKIILNNNYDVVGITILTPSYATVKKVIQLIKKLNKNIKIIVGGVHLTIRPIETLKETKEIDVGVIGEGEKTIVDVMDALQNKKSLNKIKGIVFRNKNKIVVTKPRELEDNIDNLSMPARSLLPMHLYKPAPTYYRKLPSYTMLTSRGCPFRCIYCSKISGRVYRYHSIDRIIEEMKILIKKYKAKEIIFRDDTFTIKRDFVYRLCNKIIEEKLNKKIRWTCMTRVNLVDYNLLKLMKKAGCWSIHYGIESGSQRLIDLIKKDITLEQAKDAIKWTKSAGIETKAFFMIGLPTETKEESLQTINFAKQLNPHMIQLTITVPYPGTGLYELAKNNGTLKSLNWEDYHTWAGWTSRDLVYIPKGRNQEELKELQKKAMREFYFRPKVIIRLILSIRSLVMLKDYINGALALIKSKFNKKEMKNEYSIN